MTIRAMSIVTQMLQAIGEDIDREGLLDTPGRVVKSWAELYSGYKIDPREILTTTFDGQGYDQMVVVKDIELYSTCEHHMLPFVGKAHVAYLPNKRVVGLSKIARVVEVFARRLQIQERLTNQISDAIEQALEPLGVAVMIEAKHFCMISRGVNKQNSTMITTALRGSFREPGAKAEFFSSCKS